MPIGWYVRVTTAEVHDGVYNTLLYIAGYPAPEDARVAVQGTRSKPGEQYEVLDGEIVTGVGPQPQPGEVRLLCSAV